MFQYMRNYLLKLSSHFLFLNEIKIVIEEISFKMRDTSQTYTHKPHNFLQAKH